MGTSEPAPVQVSVAHGWARVSRVYRACIHPIHAPSHPDPIHYMGTLPGRGRVYRVYPKTGGTFRTLHFSVSFFFLRSSYLNPSKLDPRDTRGGGPIYCMGSWPAVRVSSRYTRDTRAHSIHALNTQRGSMHRMGSRPGVRVFSRVLADTRANIRATCPEHEVTLFMKAQACACAGLCI